MMATTQNNAPSALGIAYKAVVSLGYTHSKLTKQYLGVNYPTLRRIKKGLPLKKATEQHYLDLFIGLINQEYNRRIANGGDGSQLPLIVMKDILLAMRKEWK